MGIDKRLDGRTNPYVGRAGGGKS